MDKFARGLGAVTETVETTIGDLIEAVTQIALEAGKSQEEGYKLASLTLAHILQKNQIEFDEHLDFDA